MKDVEVISAYQDGLSAQDIAKANHISIGTVYNILKRNNIATARAYRMTSAKENEETVVRLYKQCESVFSISQKIGLSTHMIEKILFSAGLSHSISQAKRLNPDFRESYFSEIDTAEKAYWLGWLLTDGSVTQDYHISLALTATDIDILHLLESDLGLINKVKPFRREYARLLFGSKNMCNDLAMYGIVPNKGHTVTLPHVSDHLLSHLLRGCFDGDGGLTLSYRHGKPAVELSFTKNESFVSAFNDAVSALTGITPKSITSNHSVKRVRWSSLPEVKHILSTLYADCGVHRLSRKHEIFQSIELL